MRQWLLWMVSFTDGSSIILHGGRRVVSVAGLLALTIGPESSVGDVTMVLQAEELWYPRVQEKKELGWAGERRYASSPSPDILQSIQRLLVPGRSLWVNAGGIWGVSPGWRGTYAFVVTSELMIWLERLQLTQVELRPGLDISWKQARNVLSGWTLEVHIKHWLGVAAKDVINRPNVSGEKILCMRSRKGAYKRQELWLDTSHWLGRSEDPFYLACEEGEES